MRSEKSLRDEFAMAALAAIIESGDIYGRQPMNAAAIAFRYADAMLHERRKGNGDE